jgi:hypothetical protein
LDRVLAAFRLQEGKEKESLEFYFLLVVVWKERNKRILFNPEIGRVAQLVQEEVICIL